ncbi:MAG: hypothetical protein AAF202_02055, partial [Pseudomonadota bacterium]
VLEAIDKVPLLKEAYRATFSATQLVEEHFGFNMSHAYKWGIDKYMQSTWSNFEMALAAGGAAATGAALYWQIKKFHRNSEVKRITRAFDEQVNRFLQNPDFEGEKI